MKAPQFWYAPPGTLARLLTPFAKTYRAAAQLHRAIARPYRASIPVICVGNVVAGGAGKTPTALALAALLQQQGHKPVFVTRGYGGSQRGPLLVDPAHHSAEDVGDEAMLLQRQAPVWIGRDRVKAIREAEKSATHIILDDGLQNPNINPEISLLVMDGAVGLGNQQLIPAGPLREPLTEALQRATAILIIGEPTNHQTDEVPPPLAGSAKSRGLGRARGGLSPQSQSWPNQIKNSTKPILRARLESVIPANFPRTAKFLAFAGIGRPEKFYALCRKEGLTLAATQDFPDHHPFTRRDLESLDRQAKPLNAKLLTTEKDYVRLPRWFRDRVQTFPIRLIFEDTAALLATIDKRAAR